LEKDHIPQAKQGAWGQIGRVFFAPSSAFDFLAEHHNWLPPFLISGAIGMIASLLSISAVFKVQAAVMQRIMADRPEAQQPASTLNAVQSLQHVVTYGTAVVGPWLLPLFVSLVAAFILGLVSLTGKDGIPFRRLYGIAMWATLPAGVTSAILQSVWLVTVPTESALADGGHLNATLTLLTPALSHSSWTFRILWSANLFTIWTAVLIAIGYFALSRRSALRATLAALAYWVLASGYGLYGLAQVDKVVK